ncbi:MAG: hypothetical protein ACJ75B_06715 [Flavisolibacter sp.]
MRMPLRTTFFYSLLVCQVLTSCNNSANSSASADTTGFFSDTMDASLDSSSFGHTSDTSHSINEDGGQVDSTITDGSTTPQQREKTAVLGYSYFKDMKQKETRDIHAYVTINNPASTVVSVLKEFNAQDIPQRKNDTASIFTKNIFQYKWLDVTLVDPDHDFTIVSIHPNSLQQIDPVNGNHWQWSVTPKTDKKLVRIKLRVQGIYSDQKKEQFESEEIPIIIHLNYGIFRTIWTWIEVNPEKALTIVFIPLLAYFANNFFKRKRKNPSDPAS